MKHRNSSPLRHSQIWSLEVFKAMYHYGPAQLRFWALALVIGVLAALATVGFRLGIQQVQQLIYGTDTQLLSVGLRKLPWYLILLVPGIGGLLVGLIMQRYTDNGVNRSVAHVIEGAALQGGRIEGRAGVASALASFITLSTGGSAGREGPVVHLAALISSKITRILELNGVTGRDLMGCAVAAAVSASFNTPIAGTIFAMEVVLRHYAARSFGPLVISAVIGAMISRLFFGDISEFTVPLEALKFYHEIPAFAVLGMVCGLVAVVFMRAAFWATDVGDILQKRFSVPIWLRPVIAGLLLGFIALWFPHIIGAGYETISLALTGQLLFGTAVVFTIVKTAAFAITFAGRMGGGIFTPSLMMGALTGLAFGDVATMVFPSAFGSETIYALAGMAAVAAAVLGAPLSSAMIVFEMTGDWQLGMAVMVAVATASSLAGKFVARSFFLELLERRGVRLAAGPQAYLLSLIPVSDLFRSREMLVQQVRDLCIHMMAEGVFVTAKSTLEVALPKFESTGQDFIPVVAADDETRLIGALYQVDALRAYTEALAQSAHEEHS